MQLDVEVSAPAFVRAQPELECTCSVPGVYMQGRLNVSCICIAQHDFLSSDFLSSLNFGQVTDIQTQYDAYDRQTDTIRCI